MKIKLITRWRDTTKKDSKGFGKLYMPSSIVTVTKENGKDLVARGIATEVVEPKKKKATKNGAPKNIEKK